MELAQDLPSGNKIAAEACRRGIWLPEDSGPRVLMALMRHSNVTTTTKYV